jgi:hypothetical protein
MLGCVFVFWGLVISNDDFGGAGVLNKRHPSIVEIVGKSQMGINTKVIHEMANMCDDLHIAICAYDS